MTRLEVRMSKLRTTLALMAALSHPSFAQTESGTTPVASKLRTRVAIAHSLPKLDGSALNTTVLEVNYGPGEASTPHTHPCPVIGYVKSGSLRTQVKGQPEKILNTGESFYEAPNAVHLISANASRTEPASFLAIFICDGDAPLSSNLAPRIMSGEKR